MLERIQTVLEFYRERGVNKEKINELYFKILTIINKK
jgi:hypothetical protein